MCIYVYIRVYMCLEANRTSSAMEVCIMEARQKVVGDWINDEGVDRLSADSVAAKCGTKPGKRLKRGCGEAVDTPIRTGQTEHHRLQVD
jgi:hypothetical protein